jgi:hypothetical protein
MNSLYEVLDKLDKNQELLAPEREFLFHQLTSGQCKKHFHKLLVVGEELSPEERMRILSTLSHLTDIRDVTRLLEKIEYTLKGFGYSGGFANNNQPIFNNDPLSYNYSGEPSVIQSFNVQHIIPKCVNRNISQQSMEDKISKFLSNNEPYQEIRINSDEENLDSHNFYVSIEEEEQNAEDYINYLKTKITPSINVFVELVKLICDTLMKDDFLNYYP